MRASRGASYETPLPTSLPLPDDDNRNCKFIVPKQYAITIQIDKYLILIEQQIIRFTNLMHLNMCLLI